MSPMFRLRRRLDCENRIFRRAKEDGDFNAEVQTVPPVF